MNQQMAAIVVHIRTADLWNMEPTKSRPRTSSRKEEVPANTRVIHEDDKLIIESEDLRPAHAGI